MARKELRPAPPFSGAMLDTSVWVAVFEGEAVADDLETAQGELDTLSSPLVLAELASLYARGRMEESSPMETVVATSRVEELTVEDSLLGGEIHGRLRGGGHPKVGLGDCLIYATTRRVGGLLITCDADLAKEQDVIVLPQRKGRKRTGLPRERG